MIKAAFFDIDGTLLSHKTKQVSRSTREALDKLKAAGIRCVAATGRQLGEMEKLPVADIAFDGYLTLNGQLLLDGEKHVLHGTPVTGAPKEYLLKLFREKTIPILLVEQEQMSLNFVNSLVTEVQESISTEVPPLGEYQGGEIYQVCAYLTDADAHLLAPVAEACEITRWNLGGVDIIAKGGGKVAGIQHYLEANGILPEETIAFGDGDNDIGMLKFAGIGVAMGNAWENVKQAADYVTTDVDEDGIEHALRHFGLIK